MAYVRQDSLVSNPQDAAIKNMRGKTISYNWAELNRQRQTSAYDQGLANTKNQVRQANQIVGSGTAAALGIMDGYEITDQYDRIIEQMLGGAGLNSAIADYEAAGVTAKGEITRATEQAVEEWGIGADEAATLLGDALAQNMGWYEDFAKEHTAQEMFNTGMSGLEPIMKETSQGFINYAQAGGVSPKVVNSISNMFKEQSGDVFADFTAQMVQQATALDERLLGAKSSTLGDYTSNIAKIRENEGIGKAGIYERSGQNLANITMEVPRLTSSLRTEAEQNALNALQGKQSFVSSMANIPLAGASAQSGNIMSPNYLNYASNAMGSFAPVSVPAAKSSTPLGYNSLQSQLDRKNAGLS